MGAQCSAKNSLTYSIPYGEPQAEDESALYANPYMPELAGCDGLKSCWENFEVAVSSTGDKPAVGTREKQADGTLGKYVWKSWKEVAETVANLHAGLQSLDAFPLQSFPEESVQQTFKFLGVTGKNREEYLETMLAAYRAGVCLVPLYDTLGENTYEYCINQTGLKTVIVGDLKIASKLLHVAKKCECFKIIVCMDAVSDELKQEANASGVTIHSFEEVCEIGKQKPVDPTPAQSDMEINTICYTSGTTGNPKGVLVTHRALLTALSTSDELFKKEGFKIDFNDTHISYLPYAHVMERAVTEICVRRGMRIAFYSGDTTKIVDDIQLARPTVFFSVPRLYTRIYDRILSQAAAAGGIKKSLFDRALESKLTELRSTGNFTHKLWDAIVFSKIKDVLGGRVRFLVTGSAPMAKEVQEVLKVCFCCPMMEAFGMTETACCGTATAALDPTTGHVGGVVPGILLKVKGIPEMGYSPNDRGENGELMPRGELMVKGAAVFPGYFKEPEKTKEALDADGWLRTGDVCVINPNGSFKIIDRAKNIFKLAQGEYVAPEKIENIYIQCESVAQAFVTGYGTEKVLVCVVVPDEGYAKNWAKEKGLEGDAASLSALCATHGDLEAEVFKQIDAIGKARGLSGIEKAKAVRLYAEPFSVENDLLTATFKLKRHQANKTFKAQIDEMYAELNAKEKARGGS
uniref:AMP-dependent synthetase/ligase domain-containing protein n=1 Tax=Chromera velia CCMP2878 TaxID=1169474 RepID=A0A0G4ID64_9ALVE|eukprot:Cvel_2306.t1-p1 / transcript=Cvel_2306.t1 / gene=Cvel_2306 / organism=Chromera_velia_CCMP2878 / gene_product=Long chain acyl-CoA synthetase 6, peroxisomal, putative / transcript_product=Long chain acyl-CoA synthetase 6, peroxisomal, putative / location=Cvel_scaffold89:64855-73201(-) / protein_length=689 / sequence_SO=supercontig / SO=protein_coding / is_pseudo=false